MDSWNFFLGEKKQFLKFPKMNLIELNSIKFIFLLNTKGISLIEFNWI